MARIGRFLYRHRTLVRILHRVVHPGVGTDTYLHGGCFVCRAIWTGVITPSLMDDIQPPDPRTLA